jgi:heme/copper-type cytochrome/quinol oxidase subunit 3
MGGPGDHPGMARKAAAGPMDAGSLVVATTSTTILLLLSSSVAGVAAVLLRDRDRPARCLHLLCSAPPRYD